MSLSARFIDAWACLGVGGVAASGIGPGLGFFVCGGSLTVPCSASALVRRALALSLSFSFWLRMLLRNIGGHGWRGGSLQSKQLVKTNDAMTERHASTRGTDPFALYF